ncbi:hypothetical protein Tco_1211275 [Tanacetum coccineum]
MFATKNCGSQVQKVWILVVLPFGKKAIAQSGLYQNKKGERASCVVRNKQRFILYVFPSMCLSIEFLGITKGKPMNWAFGILEWSHLTWHLYSDGDYAGAILSRKSTNRSVKYEANILFTTSVAFSRGLMGFRESLRRVFDGTEALLLPTLFILWLATVRTNNADLVPLGKVCTAIETLKKIPHQAPFEPQTDPSPPHSSEAPFEPQTDPSPRPSPSTLIPDSIPESSGGEFLEVVSFESKDLQERSSQVIMGADSESENDLDGGGSKKTPPIAKGQEMLVDEPRRIMLKMYFVHATKVSTDKEETEKKFKQLACDEEMDRMASRKKKEEQFTIEERAKFTSDTISQWESLGLSHFYHGWYLHIFDRQDLFHLYDLIRDQFSEVTLDGFELILWGDLKIMMESSTEGNEQSDFWSGQQDWKIVT